jgi:Zn-dependent protease with chaperone function
MTVNTKTTPRSHEHPAVVKARRNSDYLILVLVLLITAVIASFAVFVMTFTLSAVEVFDEDMSTTMGYGVACVVGTLFVMIFIRVQRQMYLGNALQVEFSNYAWLRDWSNTVSSDLGMPRTEIFITQDPYINAFSLGFMRPYNIVLNSGAIRYLTKDELKMVVLHEMAHIKFGHTKVSTYTLVIREMPLVGPLFSWMLGFFSRRAEITADNLSYFYLNNPELVKNSLVKVHVGPDVADDFNDIARQWQAHNTNTSFNSFSQTFSDHPFLVRRLQNIDLQHARTNGNTQNATD